MSKFTENTLLKVAAGIFMFVGAMASARVGNAELQQNRFAALSPETQQISEKIIQTYNEYQIYSGTVALNPINAHDLMHKQVQGIRSARFVSDPNALQSESRIEQVVSKWNQKSQS